MMYDLVLAHDDDGPTAAELAAIEAEMPLIEAQIALLDAEIRLVSACRPTELDWRRLRRAQQRVTRQMTAYRAATPTSAQLAA